MSYYWCYQCVNGYFCRARSYISFLHLLPMSPSYIGARRLQVGGSSEPVKWSVQVYSPRGCVVSTVMSAGCLSLMYIYLTLCSVIGNVY
ncbi:hypothetical protein I7I53_09406 [Histoplasma capsulatum var. duboisii H88]|uniref:Uncharacterized protein n=1 Tax=Ajellomyces capsulatus (strain H88) TaxID=544711 RepID=A0A8A1L9L5_AJEC8|nr:hypothetical protein I7I53_09406 [Histoplasma capsulatum var. duboisii H88]